jgi:hypothetical protein
MIKALEFTSRGDEDSVTIMYNGKQAVIKKKFLEPTELFETGVYNSETDVNSNPKTDENKPDDSAAVISRVSERIKEITHSLDEIRLFVKDNSTFSHDSLDSCISELSAYVKSLEDESNTISSDSVN